MTPATRETLLRTLQLREEHLTRRIETLSLRGGRRSRETKNKLIAQASGELVELVAAHAELLAIDR